MFINVLYLLYYYQKHTFVFAYELNTIIINFYYFMLHCRGIIFSHGSSNHCCLL